MRAIAAGLTDVGRERAHNEDRYILLPQFNVYVVADGMGGHQSGEVASRLAASTIAQYFRNQTPDTGEEIAARLRDAVVDANAQIFARADAARALRGMGTTVVAGAYAPREHTFHIAHAGDSRAYRIRREEIVQLTRDHSLLSDALLERPELTEADLAYLPRNVITRALGIGPHVDVDVNSVEVDVGDIFLLCSDGLHGLVDEDVIVSIVTKYDSLTAACQKLVDIANENGGKDNITAVLVRIEEEPEPWSQRTPRTPSSRPGQPISRRSVVSAIASSGHHPSELGHGELDADTAPDGIPALVDEQTEDDDPSSLDAKTDVMDVPVGVVDDVDPPTEDEAPSLEDEDTLRIKLRVGKSDAETSEPAKAQQAKKVPAEDAVPDETPTEEPKAPPAKKRRRRRKPKGS